jgi:hypothetical protein
MSNRPNLRQSFIPTLPPAIIVSALCLIIALLVFPQPEAAVYEAAIDSVGFQSMVPPLAGVSFWPTFTPASLYLASLSALWFLLRAEIHSGDAARLGAARGQAASLSLLAVAMPVMIPIMLRGGPASTPALRVVVVLTIAGSLVLAGLYLGIFAVAQRRWLSLGKPPVAWIRSVALGGAVMSLAALAWAAAQPSWMSMLSALVIIGSDLILVVVLLRQPSPAPLDADTLAWAQLAMSRTTNGALGSVVALVLPLMAMASVSVSFVTLTLRFPSALLGERILTSVQSSLSLARYVRSAYSAQAILVVVTSVAAVVVIGLLMLFVSGRMSLMRRTAGRPLNADDSCGRKTPSLDRTSDWEV